MARLLSGLAGIVALLVLAIGTAAESCADANPWPYGGKNFLLPGQSLTAGQSLKSGTAVLSVQTDGNVVITRNRDGATLWTTSTANTCNGPVFQFTGANLVLSNASGQPCWTAAMLTGSSIAVLMDHCALETFMEAPMTNQTWFSNPPGCIRAHIVPHSHDDVGWLLTPENYYDGCQTPGGGVRGILDTVTSALANNPNRTFNQVESYFFNRWWQEKNETVRDAVRELVKKGQLVFLNGGWSMHDEACVHQESAISNMEVGAKFLKDELGVELNIGWHIDPFGHASATPRYMAEMGFDAFFFWRTDYQHKEHMMHHKTFESMWHNSPSLGNKTLMFTSIMYNNYCFGCQDSTCPSSFYSYDCEAWSPMVQGKATTQHMSPAMAMLARMAAQKQTKIADIERRFNFKAQSSSIPPNVQAIAEAYVNTIIEYEAAFRTRNVLMPWGCDFGHENAHEDFELMDQIIEFINDNYASYGIEIFYSTAQRYMKDIKAADYQWPINEYDYFLDSDSGHSYWSGYLSSRAEYKGFERMLMNERTSADIMLSAVPGSSVNLSAALAGASEMRQMMGVAQHHDSITGTERQYVRDQYQLLLTRANKEISATSGDVVSAATGVATSPCPLANLSYCPLVEPLATGVNVSAYIFNPLAQPRVEVITIPVPVVGVRAYLMPGGVPLTSQVVSTWELTTTVDNTSPAVPSHLPYQIYVNVSLPPLSLVEILLVADSSAKPAKEVEMVRDSPLVIGNELYILEFDNATGRVSSVTNLETFETSVIDQNIGHYCPHPQGYQEQAAGAYIMRTCDPYGPLYPYSSNYTVKVVYGTLCSEVRQYIDNDNNIHQAFRLCSGQRYVEIQSGIGEVKTLNTGVEVIMKLQTDIPTAGVWYTDSQALEMQRRVRDSRPNYPYTLTEPIASNFFPCNAFSLLNSSTSGKNVAVTADRSRATASIRDGELEFLVQRRLIYDDNRGVGEPLDEITRVLTISRVVFNVKDLNRDMRLNSLLQTHRPIVRFGAPSNQAAPFKHFSFPNKPLLPVNVHLHTRTVHKEGEMLVRLQHLFAHGEGELAAPATFDLSAVIPPGMSVTSVTDMDMNGVYPASEMQRVDFPTCNAGTLLHVPPRAIGGEHPVTNGQLSTVTLQAMEIRVLRVNFTWKAETH